MIRLAVAAVMVAAGVAATGVFVRTIAAAADETPSHWALVRVGATAADADLARVRVGVVDSGVDGSHPELRGRVLLGHDFVDGGPGNHDPLGHGTSVAGVIAGSDVGVARNAVILPVRVIDSNGFATVRRVARGIRWAAENGSRVVNASVETPKGSRALEAALSYAWARQAVVVAASGNQGGGVQYPGAYPSAFAVGATRRSNDVATFSGRGRELDLVAPGVDVRTLRPGGAYTRASGSSVAAPFVAGAAALLIGQEPNLTAAELHGRLGRSARDLGERGRDDVYGAGLLDVAAALDSS